MDALPLCHSAKTYYHIPIRMRRISRTDVPKGVREQFDQLRRTAL
jgi:hypothetical protein